jgi:hypothetical protein
MVTFINSDYSDVYKNVNCIPKTASTITIEGNHGKKIIYKYKKVNLNNYSIPSTKPESLHTTLLCSKYSEK